ncbi:MAG: mannose-1-phosphate guanylyltransferase/mannose-6-phosphate isomerase [Burkholderiales bacterium RIFCSPLOWO2_02_FULL_57_36]|nr:MAG: mannose-1-phosphate guanylyltransferase/mannose-6-phosphate isomerase [Burkholderiales bacterium RIFCSPLOWO2_02_FULL_57_36]
MTLIPVILCGGSGTRLWPLSRRAYPKQFLALNSEQSLFQETLLRLSGKAEIAAPLIVTNSEYRFIVAEQLRLTGISAQNILLEPVSRNTAPAIAAAALLAIESNADATLLILPSDHVIGSPQIFRQLLSTASAAAAQGKMVTFGIVPTSPHTGYGYIQRGAAHVTDGLYDIASFIEKPDEALAKIFLESGDYFWNSGMYVFRAERYIAELKKRQPDMLAAVERAVRLAQKDLDFLRLDPVAFASCPSDSIDYAVMEHTSHAAVVAADIAWNDIGSWSALAEICPLDDSGNTLQGDVIVDNVQNCMIRSERRLVAAAGVQDLVIAETADAVLVVHKNDTQGVKHIVARLNANGRTLGAVHSHVYRPWGHYESIDAGERFQVKRIVVNPGAALSLQMHHHRAEHWIVVKGTARVTRGDEVFLLSENQSTYISVQQTHRLENPGTMPLEVIEVQSGVYLGEDDIVRFEDAYGRA